jgi:hypothetical protein
VIHLVVRVGLAIRGLLQAADRSRTPKAAPAGSRAWSLQARRSGAAGNRCRCSVAATLADPAAAWLFRAWSRTSVTRDTLVNVDQTIYETLAGDAHGLDRRRHVSSSPRSAAIYVVDTVVDLGCAVARNRFGVRHSLTG